MNINFLIYKKKARRDNSNVKVLRRQRGWYVVRCTAIYICNQYRCGNAIDYIV